MRPVATSETLCRVNIFSATSVTAVGVQSCASTVGTYYRGSRERLRLYSTDYCIEQSITADRVRHLYCHSIPPRCVTIILQGKPGPNRTANQNCGFCPARQILSQSSSSIIPLSKSGLAGISIHHTTPFTHRTG